MMESLIIMFILFLFTVFMWLKLDYDSEKKYHELQKEAVQKGYAIWAVDEDGKTAFKWKDEKGEDSDI